MEPGEIRHHLDTVRSLPRHDAWKLIQRFMTLLESGDARAATPDPAAPIGWRVEHWVKQGILAAFALGENVDYSDGLFHHRDKNTLPPRHHTPEGVRTVPGGSAIRRGACVRPGVIIMPPAYVNVGAYVGENTLIDSHALVGSCAQIGARVHLSAAAQIGGVLEPIGALPVIIEDDCFVGGNCGVYEGVIVGRAAVLAAGVILTSSVAVHDLVQQRIIQADPADGRPLMIPPGAVVVMGSRPAGGAFAQERGLHMATPLIVKYRDERTDAKTALETALR